MMARQFTATKAVRERVPMLVGIIGPSGSGKTYSALRMATGMVEKTGGRIKFIDTEARRALHYADTFDFDHIAMDPPFSPQDYLEAIKFASSGSKDDVLIIDSMSHEHEGQGGLLEMHEAELDRMAGNDYRKRDRVKFAAWIKPKAQRRMLINAILQMGVNAIFCFRAKEKTKPGNKQAGEEAVVHLGWQAVAGEEFVFEMLINVLLYPGANGVPNWQPDVRGEFAMTKLPRMFEEFFPRGRQVDELLGEQIADWAAGKKPENPHAKPAKKAARKRKPKVSDAVKRLATAKDIDDLNAIRRELAGGHAWKDGEVALLREASEARKAELSKVGEQFDERGGFSPPETPPAGVEQGDGGAAAPSPDSQTGPEAPEDRSGEVDPDTGERVPSEEEIASESAAEEPGDDHVEGW